MGAKAENPITLRKKIGTGKREFARTYAIFYCKSGFIEKRCKNA